MNLNKLETSFYILKKYIFINVKHFFGNRLIKLAQV